ncbi:hypothetical protein AGDE_00205 [Angomonas deanei]|nr:hypothetical protein AGDE_00205 [Angomonas deanei]|eukprot:EPY43716.1 hypothetical protein AGDE_00205 [Angomonas deanei]
MTTYTQSTAVEVADENTALRTRLAQLQEEERKQNAGNNNQFTVDTSTVDRLKSQNKGIKQKITELERELVQLKSINIQELYHEYSRLSAKRNHLSNENAALANVLANQRRDVKKATKNVNSHQELRRTNAEKNAADKTDIQMFRERREALQKETSKLTKEEAKLEEELRSMPAHQEQVETEVRLLKEDNFKKDRLIEQLGNDVHSKGGQQEAGETSDGDIAQLREEYVQLKEELKRAKS